MKRTIYLLALLGVLAVCWRAAAQNTQSYRDKFPAEIAAMIPAGARVISHVMSYDNSSASLEVVAELPNQAYKPGVYQAASINLKITVYEPGTEVGKYMMDSMLGMQSQSYAEARRSMSEPAHPNLKEAGPLQETDNQYGKAWYRRSTFRPAGGGQAEEVYYACRYVARANNAFFSLDVRALPLARDKADQWFRDIAARAVRLSVASLVR